MFEQLDPEVDCITCVTFCHEPHLVLILSLDTEHVIVYDLDKREKLQSFKGHSYSPTAGYFRQSNMSRLVTFSKHEIIYWRVYKDESDLLQLRQEFMYPSGACRPVLSNGQNLIAIVQNNKLKVWTQNVI